MSKILSVGVMTGTSCDGADLCALEIQDAGNGTVEKIVEKIMATASYRFPSTLRTSLLNAQKGDVPVRLLGKITLEYSVWLARQCEIFIRNEKLNRKDLIISAHGQTVWHSPPKSRNETGFSMQILDASHIAILTGCTVVSGFRQADMAAGGQGAPLVPYYHWLKVKSSDLKTLIPLAIHNVGGIANLTIVTSDPEKMIAFDTGPGNCLIDISTELFTRGKKKFDQNGQFAKKHLDEINWKKIYELASSDYFMKNPPKTTGRELFNTDYLKKFGSKNGQLIAETTALTSVTMAQAYKRYLKEINNIFLAGGGSQNPVLLALFEQEINKLSKGVRVAVLPDSCMDSQFLEAAAFARFGFESLKNQPVALNKITGARVRASGAFIFPGRNFNRLMKSLY